ncbi:copper resistance system multicopper oxidase [Marinospirillum sp.]|uniref:copper resistance system multicopper oxidase n=1 Tax=Marinospirillum sp. TaxID=2183934 RepID=UPI0028701711|nr:copper resistance system multicopper oxidase [Marinospirillum sp.]MDR9468019.1 copper resistance system multicopper oxidase [Marinospirillum sp.]
MRTLKKIAVFTGSLLFPAVLLAAEYELSVDPVMIDTGDFTKIGVGYNGSSPGPTLRMKEGETATIKVTNNLDVDTSIHWHGLIVPADQDGVPGISFDGIKPGETFTYTFPVRQNGTYWYHSHSGFQEPDGAYGSLVIEAEDREPFRYDRDYVVQLADKHPDAGAQIMHNLKNSAEYYNRTEQTLPDFFSDIGENGFLATVKDRWDWGNMRMMKTDIEDVQGFTGLINGKGPDQNWTGQFEPGERVRLRLINSSASTYFDFRIPGMKMTVVAADGNNIQPVVVDELRLAVAETYDVIVQPREDKAYTLFAESMGRTGYARGTLAPREGMTAAVPEMREPPLLTMADMGHGGMDHGSMSDTEMNASDMDHSSMDHSAMDAADPFYAPGSGLLPQAASGGKFLSYADLRAQQPRYDYREPEREIVLRLTGNMERYIWSINGVKFEDAEPLRLQYGERVKIRFINETMMAHPMHLHGMWSLLNVGAKGDNPTKHVISVNPNTEVAVDVEVDEPGEWAFHCHIFNHANAGMFLKVVVEGGDA